MARDARAAGRGIRVPGSRPSVRPRFDQEEPPSRRLVVESWLRSAAAGIDSDAVLAPVPADAAGVADLRDGHALSRVFPLLHDVMGGAAEDTDAVLAVGDADGKLLWVRGRPSVLRRAESIHFIEGAVWDERTAGTNAPGTALRLDAPVQINGREHFARRVRRWSCAAAPIHDPDTRRILGVIDVTGGPDVATPQSMAMVRAAAALAEAELGRLAAVRRATSSTLWIPDSAATLRIDALGRSDCLVDDGRQVIRLSPRHSDILVLLAENPAGLTADQLAIEVYQEDVGSSTVRAELTRLRSLLGESTLQSRPYRLRVSVEGDWLAVRAAVTQGDVRGAVRQYRGPLLPQSQAPGIVERRDQLTQQLRSVVLASGQVDLMVEWTQRRWGAEDVEMWHEQVCRLPASSPLRPIAAAEEERLNQVFGLPAPGRVPKRR